MANAEVTLKAVVELGDESKQLLRDLRDRLPRKNGSSLCDPHPGTPCWRRDWIGEPYLPCEVAAEPPTTPGDPRPAGDRPRLHAQRQALQAVLDDLDFWIESEQENHDALQHRNCHRGEECWRQFSPSDIRDMINDAARAVGLTAFPHPLNPKEDSR